MKNHIKLASLLLAVSILLFCFVGCQVKTKSPAVSPDVSNVSSDLSSDIISSSSNVSSSSEVSSQSSITSVSSASSKVVNKSVVTTTTTISSSDTIKRADAINAEHQRHTDKLANLKSQYDSDVSKYTTDIANNKAQISSWYNFNGGTLENQQHNCTDKTYLQKLTENSKIIQKYEDDVSALNNTIVHYPDAVKQENYEYDLHMKTLKISD